MAKRQKLDYSVRKAIVKLHKEKHTIREISEKVKRSKSVVGRVVKSYNDTGKIVSAFKTDRPRNMDAYPQSLVSCRLYRVIITWKKFLLLNDCRVKTAWNQRSRISIHAVKQI